MLSYTSIKQHLVFDYKLRFPDSRLIEFCIEIDQTDVTTLERTISRNTSVQWVLSSILGLLSKSVTWSIEDGLEELRYRFKPFGVK